MSDGLQVMFLQSSPHSSETGPVFPRPAHPPAISAPSSLRPSGHFRSPVRTDRPGLVRASPTSRPGEPRASSSQNPTIRLTLFFCCCYFSHIIFLSQHVFSFLLQEIVFFFPFLLAVRCRTLFGYSGTKPMPSAEDS